MSTATLNVWITEIGDPCHIIKPNPDPVTGDPLGWFVHVLDCDGKVLEWCGTTYRDIPAKCGHAEIELPPGCYSVMASHSPKGVGVPPFGNRLTHVSVVRVNCGDHACVTLFSPSIWNCGTWFKTAIQDHTAVLVKGGMKAEVARGAVAAIDAFLKQVKIDPFTQNMEVLQKPATKE
jgi:hypothetical protein